jgi:hypothetical protein
MKVNVKNMNRNDSVYERPRSTDEVIAAIERICIPDIPNIQLAPKDLDIALANYDYFVKPGIPQRQFANKFSCIFSALKNRAEDDDDAFVRYDMALLMLIRGSFDQSYFDLQIMRRKRPFDSRKLAIQMKRFNQEQLFHFFHHIIIYRVNHGLFISTFNSNELWERLANECREVGLNVPRELDSIEGQHFLRSNPYYYFDVLSVKKISDILFDAINLDVNIATSAAKRLNERGVDAMARYLNMKVREMSA